MSAILGSEAASLKHTLEQWHLPQVSMGTDPRTAVLVVYFINLSCFCDPF